jgi:selenocysteine-specific elongation factor
MKARARGLQVHGSPVSKAFAGQRTAVNLGGVETASIQRGMVLAPSGRLQPTPVFDVLLQVLPSSPKGIRSRTRIRFHLQTAEVLGRVRVLEDGAEIAPGKHGFAQLRLESPVVAYPDAHFIIRSYSPSVTIAGGQVLNAFAAKHRAKDLPRVRQILNMLKTGDSATRFSLFVGEAKQGLRLEEIAAHTAWTNSHLTEAARTAQRANEVVECERVFVSRQLFERLRRSVLDRVDDHHKRDPLSRGLARETLRERVFNHAPPDVFRSVLTALEREGILILEKDVVRSSEHVIELSGEDAELRNRLDKIFQQSALEPPTLEAALQTAIGPGKSDANRGRRILQILVEGKQVVRVQTDLIFHRKALDELITKVRDYAEKHGPDRSIDVATFKVLAGVSRKYAIPLLEFLDRERVTRREGDRRMIL